MVWALFGGFIGLMIFRVPVTMAIGVAVLFSLVLAGLSSEIYILPLMVVEGVENPSLIAWLMSEFYRQRESKGELPAGFLDAVEASRPKKS